MFGNVFISRPVMVALSACALVTLAPGAQAVDGVLEINQTCAVNTGCFSGDTAGFPVDLSASGSYVLTGPLDSGGSNAIRVQAPNVTLDLNGFAVTGSGPEGIDLCGGGSPDRYNIVVRNGSVRGYTSYGVHCHCTDMKNVVLESLQFEDISGVFTDTSAILCGASPTVVRNCVVSGGSHQGIYVLDGAVVQGNVVTGAGGLGLDAGDSAFGDNLFADNNGGNANPQTSGGISSGGNVCGTTLGCP
jgi:putative cofactor-binding repeat protein